ncbi:hypothetical protein WBG78_20655 [Chryseolinea sp. T2]|uniref:hypothetical protein n=1 Tax=Chryseolinea sp. T2 TaxID=3129255 RepID=UPI003076930A
MFESPYNEESKELRLTDRELALLHELDKFPPMYHEDILSTYIRDSASVHALARVEVIFLQFYRWGPSSNNIYGLRMGFVDDMLQLIKKIRNGTISNGEAMVADTGSSSSHTVDRASSRMHRHALTLEEIFGDKAALFKRAFTRLMTSELLVTTRALLPHVVTYLRSNVKKFPRDVTGAIRLLKKEFPGLLPAGVDNYRTAPEFKEMVGQDVKKVVVDTFEPFIDKV